MKDTCIILLRLEGALQSWGEHSRFDYRDCASMPTKSGIVGMIGCAMGLWRGSEQLTALSEKIRVAVRCDRPGKQNIDFHTVTADDAILNADGKKKKDQHGKPVKTIVTYRTYLQDASFLAAIETNWELAQKIDHAFHEPRWPVYLGRKSCIPSRPVYIGIKEEYNSLEEAMNQYIEEKGTRLAETGKYYEIESMDGRGYERTDQLVDASKRDFMSRYVILMQRKEESKAEEQKKDN